MYRTNYSILIIFLVSITLYSAFSFEPKNLNRQNNDTNPVDFSSIDSASVQVLNKIIKDNSKYVNSLPFNELMIRIALDFVETPYIGNTLEGEPEICRVNLTGLDCVTFFENSLNIAKMLKSGDNSLEKLPKYIVNTRYRDGIVRDYSSRLHYTSDWIYQNVNNKIVEDITKKLKGEKIKFDVFFMSQSPKFYSALKIHPELIKKIKQTEVEINKRDYYFIPKDKIKKIEKKLKSGDIIAIVTSKPGLDYSHTGLIYVDKQKKARFLHASSAQKKVVMDTTISEYLKNVKTDIGITVLRPISPKK